MTKLTCLKKYLSQFLAVYLSVLLISPLALAHEPVKAATLNYPPYEYLEDHVPKGLAIDIIKEVFSRMDGGEIAFSFYPWGRAVLETINGSEDILFNAGMNEDRKKWGVYIDSVLIEQQYVFFALKESEFSINDNLNNVKNLTIGTRRHYLYGSGKLRKALDNNHFKQVAAVNSTEQNVKKLLLNRVDIFVGDYLPVMYYLAQNCLTNKIRIIKAADNHANLVALKWQTHILISKQSLLAQESKRINQIMNEMKADGSFDKLSKPYYEIAQETSKCNVQ